MATKQLLTGCGSASSTLTYYHSIHAANYNGTSTTIDASGLISTAGIIKTLRVKLSAAPGSSKTQTITLWVNGSPTILTVDVTGTATTGNDIVNEISVSPGDRVAIETKPTNTPAASSISWGLEFIPTVDGETILLSSGSGISVGNGSFLSIFTIATGTESATQLPIPCSGTFKNLYIKLSSNASANSAIFTVRKNGVNQSIVVTIPSGQSSGNDITNSFTVSAGDKISIARTGAATGNFVALGLCFVPDTLGQFIFGDNNIFYNFTNYIGLTRGINGGGETSDRQILSACTIKNLYVILSSAPGSSKSYTATLRKNGASQGLAVTISETATAGNASTDIIVADGDLLCTMTTPSGSPTAINGGVSYLGYIAPTATTRQKTILSDTKIKVLNVQKTILSDAIITSTVSKTILSDSKIKALGVQETILSDSKIIDLYQKSILSDSKIKATGIQKTILSNAKICIQVLADIINKVNTVKQVLSNINNKVNTVIRVLSDVNNCINTVKSIISDATNDFRTQKLILNNVTNDVRFMYSWQKASNGTLQSLGKSYIKIYIGGAEQTDIDVDSISISKDLDSSHTATFELGRAYDASKPAMEATVEIKYNNWVLFSGYITNISPSEDPEKIRINCQNEYWKQNKTNVYYHVGHKPTDDKELYYETLQSALVTEHGWNPGIGNFTPENIDNFAVGKSDAITNLIQEIGNYGWFYDVDGTKKLWTAGSGSIIELERQTLGENINLYDVINHSFDESVEDIVNKFRVQMGNKVIRKFDSTGGNRTYTGYNYSSYQQFVIPSWDCSYERLAKNSISGEGWDYHRPDNAYLYKDVFKKYYMPYLNTNLSSWSDRYPPKIQIYSPGGSIYGASIGTLSEGFTIDYENKMIIFNNPVYFYRKDNNGEIVSIRAANLKVFLWKKNYYTFTQSPSDNPETDISNPLMFFTDKMGTYSDTIIKDLNLSNLSIQEGGRRTLADGTEEYIPSWDDTNFAKEIANWQLSKSCDKKIKGTIEITLDALCFYNIDLTKRIYITGITDETMNIISINYNISNFTVSLTLENSRSYNRTMSIQSHGE